VKEIPENKKWLPGGLYFESHAIVQGYDLKI
jgi:hypothetical protein